MHSDFSDTIIVVTGLMTANDGTRQFYVPQRTFLYEPVVAVLVLKCLCVVIPFMLDVRVVEISWCHTGGRSHRRKVTQDFATCFLQRCLS